jgi:septal ring factor EnvC (AmiA/AmiB activator)
MTAATKQPKRSQEIADMKTDLPIETRLQSARTALHIALLGGGSNTAELRQAVRELEAEQQRAAEAQAAQEAAERAERNAAEAEREASIRAASQTLLESRNARLDAVRAHLPVRTIPDTRSSFV